MVRSTIVHALVLSLAVLAGCSTLWSNDVTRGDQLVREENWAEALLAYQRALKEDPFDESLKEKVRVTRARAALMYEQRGRAMMREGRLDQAVYALQQALRLEPTVPSHQAAYHEAARLKEADDLTQEARKLHRLGRTEEAMDAYQRAVELDPGQRDALAGISALTERAAAAKRGDQLAQRVTLRFRNAGLKEVFEGLSRAAGVNFIFDKDVRNDPVTIFIRDMTFDEALNLMLTTNSLFSQQVGPNTLLISPNTKQKQEQYQDLMIRTFYLSNAKAKDMVTLLKTMLNVKRMFANEKLNAVVIRESPEVLHLAERVILANDRKDSEVLLEVEVLEVTRTQQDNYGLDYAKQAGMGLVPPGFSGSLTQTLAQQFTLRELTSVNKDNVILTLPTVVVLDFLKSVTDSKILASPSLRVGNNQKAEINIGAKEPILLSTTNVVPGTSAGTSPTTSTVTSIEFRDTGVRLTVEPSINLQNELTLKLKIEFVRVGDTVTLQSSPEITSNRFGNRTAETSLSVKNGETIVLAGLIQEEDRQTKNAPWLLGDIPWLGPLLTSYDKQRVTTEIVVTITPKVVQSMTPPSPATQALWSGTEFSYSNEPIFLRRDRQQLPLPGPEPASLKSGNERPAGATSPEARGGGAGTQEPVGSLLAVSPADLAAAVDESFQIALLGENVEGLNEGILSVSYDPAVLEFKSAVEGELFTQGGARTSLEVSVDQERGGLRLTMRREGGAVVGTGPLAVLTFTGRAPGVSTVSAEMPTSAGDGTAEGLLQPGRGVVRVR